MAIVRILAEIFLNAKVTDEVRILAEIFLDYGLINDEVRILAEIFLNGKVTDEVRIRRPLHYTTLRAGGEFGPTNVFAYGFSQKSFG